MDNVNVSSIAFDIDEEVVNKLIKKRQESVKKYRERYEKSFLHEGQDYTVYSCWYEEALFTNKSSTITCQAATEKRQKEINGEKGNNDINRSYINILDIIDLFLPRHIQASSKIPGDNLFLFTS